MALALSEAGHEALKGFGVKLLWGWRLLAKTDHLEQLRDAQSYRSLRGRAGLLAQGECPDRIDASVFILERPTIALNSIQPIVWPSPELRDLHRYLPAELRVYQRPSPDGFGLR